MPLVEDYRYNFLCIASIVRCVLIKRQIILLLILSVLVSFPAKADYSFSQIIEGLSNPEDICLDNFQNIYVVDAGKRCIYKFDPGGRLLGKFAEEIFLHPGSICLDNFQNIYVVDAGKRCIYKFDPGGRLLTEFSKAQDREFKPLGIYVDKRGYIYVVNEALGQVEIFDNKGNFKGSLGCERKKREEIIVLPGTKRVSPVREREFIDPKDIFIDSKGYIYICDKFPYGIHGRIWKFSYQGLPLKQIVDFRFQSRFSKISVDKIGNIFVIDTRGGIGSIYKYDPQGRLIDFFGPGAGSFSWKPTGLAIDEEGKIYVTDTASGSIQCFTPSRWDKMVDRANKYFEQGNFDKAEDEWKSVIELDKTKIYPHIGLSLTYLARKKYKEAMNELRVNSREVYDEEIYSEAYKSWRKELFRSLLFPLILFIVFLAFVLKIVFPYINRYFSSHIKGLLSILIFSLKEMKKIGQKNFLWAFLILFLFSIVNYLSIYTANPLFNKDIEPGLVFFEKRTLIFFTTWLIWGIFCWIAGKIIFKGKGKFKEIIMLSAFSLLPYIIFSIPISLISRLLSPVEANRYYLWPGRIIFFWCVILLAINIKAIHKFNNVKTLLLLGIGYLSLVALKFLGVLMRVDEEMSNFLVGIIQESFSLETYIYVLILMIILAKDMVKKPVLRVGIYVFGVFFIFLVQFYQR